MCWSDFRCKFFSFCAFAFLALSLVFPSGYSYGAAGLTLLALSGAIVLNHRPLSHETWLLVAIMLVMGLIWGVDFDTPLAVMHTDFWPRYWLAAITLAIGAVWGVDLRAVIWGAAAGAVGALAIASYQYLVLGWSKASGHTNAIQFGDIAMYLGIAVWAFALFVEQRKWMLIALWGAGACGVLASLLSETRGAWVVAPLLMLCMLIFLFQQGRKRLAFGTVAMVLILLAVVVIPYGGKFGARAELAVAEMQQYLKNPQQNSETSIGQRLEQWRVALHMIESKPLLGWGVKGARAEKQRLVDHGFAHPSIMNYGHAHNEIIDMLVKRGLLGCIALIFVYLRPLCVFWPTRKRLAQFENSTQRAVLGVRMAAALLPIAYFGFGWTQVFFAHNSGNMFYIFGLVVFWAALQRLEGKTLQQDAVSARDIKVSSCTLP